MGNLLVSALVALGVCSVSVADGICGLPFGRLFDDWT